MQIGLISDIHANLPALEAVLDDMPSVDRIVCAGDIVGYNPWPAECIARVRDCTDAVVAGNHDRTVECPQRYEENPMAKAGLEHANEQLSNEQREWLSSLPRKEEFVDSDFLLVHDHPKFENKYVFPDEFLHLGRYLDEYCGVVLGHTHIQHAETVSGRLAVNPGSVGQPRNDDPRAAYAILDTETERADLRVVEYDVERVVARIEEVGLPTETGERLLSGW